MTNIKQVYNERRKIFKSNRGDKTVVQYLISKLEEHNYVYFTGTQNESTTVQDIFWRIDFQHLNGLLSLWLRRSSTMVGTSPI